MTLQTSGTSAVSDINTEIGRSSTYSEDLNFLNNLITPGVAGQSGQGSGTGADTPNQRASSPNMAAFYGLTYFQRNTSGT